MQFLYIPIQRSTSSPTASSGNSQPHYNASKLNKQLPKGASPGLADWPRLLSSLVSAQFTSLSRRNHPSTSTSAPSSSQEQGQGQGKRQGSPQVTAVNAKSRRLMASLQSAGNASHVRRGLHQICSVENTATDTQAGVWADLSRRQAS